MEYNLRYVFVLFERNKNTNRQGVVAVYTEEKDAIQKKTEFNSFAGDDVYDYKEVPFWETIEG